MSKLPRASPYCVPGPRSVYCQNVQFKSQAEELHMVREQPADGVAAGFEV